MMKPFSFKKFFYATSVVILSIASTIQATEQDKALCSIPRSLTARFSKDEFVGLAAQRVPTQFTGQNIYNPSLVLAYRKHVQEYKGSIKERVDIEHCEALLPLTDILKNYIKSYILSHADQSAKFSKEIDSHLANRNVNPLWIYGIHLRFAAAISDVTADERDLLLHVVNPNIFTGLITDGAWNDHFSTIAGIGLADDRDQHVTTYYSGKNLHWDVVNQIEKEMLKHFPTSTYYPLAGAGKLGVSFLIARYLENVFPLGLPKSARLKAHGCNLSKVSFIVHDALHGDVDPRFGALKSHVYQKTDDFVGKGGAAVPFIKFYSKQAVLRYGLVMGALQEILYSFQSYLLPHYGKDEFNKTMAGFFLPIHELLSWSPNIFDNNDFDDIITSLVKGTKKGFMSEEVWESPFDPLETSPLDGKSTLSKQKIIKYAFENDLVNHSKLILPHNYYSIYPLPDRSAYVKEKLIHAARVVPSPRFIDVEFDLKTGQSIRITYPTLYHKWLNMDDSRGLLRFMAGLDIPKPDISYLSIEEGRQIAKETLVTVRTALLNLLDDFQTRALFFSNYKKHDGLSLSDRYFTWHYNHQQRIEAIIVKVLPK